VGKTGKSTEAVNLQLAERNFGGGGSDEKPADLCRWMPAFALSGVTLASRNLKVLLSATDDMTMPRVFQSSSRNTQMFLATAAAVFLILAGLPGNIVFAQVQTATPAREIRPLHTLPLTAFYDSPHPLPPGKPGELIRSEPIDEYNLPFELSALRILYHSRTAHGEDVPVSAVVLVPEGKPPASGWPVVAWAHEFRGAARQCAPSLMKNLGAGPLLAMYANLGYAVVATDYSGLGADSGHAVLDMQSNALDVIYSVSAARAAVKGIGAKWIALGPFQGSLAAVAVAETDLHDPNYLGSVATSGIADAQQAYERFAPGSSSIRMLLVLASTVKALFPEFQVSDMLKDAALPAYQRVARTCGGETDPEFTNEMLKPGWESNRFVKEFFSRNTPGQKRARGPLLVISGEVDPAIPSDVSEKTVARMCKQGDRVLFLKYPDVDASGVMGASVADQISWIKARFAGDAAPGNCR
jgi:Secretory lipase